MPVIPSRADGEGPPSGTCRVFQPSDEQRRHSSDACSGL